tara:strand:- start:343 stop:672 length:330 start_codon:yes stop_codon:yes gene_type:complete
MEVKTEINTELHFEPINSDENITRCVFDDNNDLLGFILSNASYEVVHLICIDNNIFVSHDIAQIGKFVNMYNNFLQDGIDIYLQEYESYEEAYKVSLSLQETSFFCYSK